MAGGDRSENDKSARKHVLIALICAADDQLSRSLRTIALPLTLCSVSYKGFNQSIAAGATLHLYQEGACREYKYLNSFLLHQ